MPVLIAMLIGGLVSALGSVIGRIIISLGIGFVTYQGFNVLLGFIKTRISTEISSLDPLILQIFSTLQIDTAINILFSAYAVRLVIQGVTGGSVTRTKLKA